MDFREINCKESELFDPLNNVCRKFKKTSIEECPTMELDKNSFYVHENGTLTENKTGVSYPRGNYKLNVEGALICSERFNYLTNLTRYNRVLTMSVLIISIVSLSLHIGIFLLFPKFRNLPGKNLFSLSCSLLAAYIILLLGPRVSAIHVACLMSGSLLHYFLLASFCWMNVMSLDVYITFKGHIHRHAAIGGKTYVKYSIYAWGIPAIVVAVALTAQFTDVIPYLKPHYSDMICWILNRDSKIIFFLVPVGIIMLTNVIFFIGTSFELYKQNRSAKFAMQRSQSLKGKNNSKESRKTSKVEHSNFNVSTNTIYIFRNVWI